MKITHINIQSYQRVVGLGIQPGAPVLLIAADNEAGKTSTLMAIRHALTGRSDLIERKKDLAALVYRGAKIGYARVATDLGESCITLPNGTHESGFAPGPYLPVLLDHERFAALGPVERREILFCLSGLADATQAGVDRLRRRGMDAERVERIAATLATGGFEAAQAGAKALARDARAGWKAITGEAYGDIKGGSWRAPKPEVPDLEGVGVDFDAAKADLESARTSLAEAKATHSQFAATEARRAALRGRAEQLEKRQRKLEHDQGEYDAWAARMAELPADPDSAEVRVPVACTECGALHTIQGNALREYRPPKQDDPETALKRREWKKALEMYTRSVENDKRDIADSEAAIAALTALEDIRDVKASELEALEARVSILSKRCAALQDARNAAASAKAKADAADDNTRKAAGYHADVQGWEAIAAALEEIPMEMLAEAMGPMNDRLRATSVATGWAQVAIEPDMSITAGGIPYKLLSKSAKWRANAAITEAISHLSGLRFLCLDELDILSAPNRIKALTWLHKLASSGEVEQVVAAATLREPPTCPPTFDVRWLSAGELVEMREEKAA